MSSSQANDDRMNDRMTQWQKGQNEVLRGSASKNVSENNGQLRFRPPPQVEHASRLDQKKKVSENDGQLRFRPPPQVEHANRLDKLIGSFLLYGWAWVMEL